MYDLRTTWTVGLRDLAGVPIYRQDAIDAVNKILRSYCIDAYTVVDCAGYWRGAPEEALQVSVLSVAEYVTNDSELPDDSWAAEAAGCLAKALNQECVLVELAQIQGRLVYP